MPRGGRSGSQPVYTRAIADEILDRLASGESLRSICRDAHMPSEKAVKNWTVERADTFGREYMRARELGYDSIAEGLLEFGQGEVTGPDGYVDNGEIQRLRLLSENRKWLLSKMMPRQYGDKVTQEIVGDADQPLITRIELVPVDPRPHRTIDADDATPVLPREEKPR
jgi:Bacteriophage Sf6, terminase small subunit-like